MTDIRREVHEEIDRMTEDEVLGLKKFLATYPDRLGAVFRNAPFDDEPLTEEERLAVAEAELLRRSLRAVIPADESKPWMRYAGMVETGDPRSSERIDEIVYGTER